MTFGVANIDRQLLLTMGAACQVRQVIPYFRGANRGRDRESRRFYRAQLLDVVSRQEIVDAFRSTHGMLPALEKR
jgi:hypothetical protein